MKIIYKNEHDTEEFDKERYLNSLRSYGEIDEDLAQEVIKEKIEAFPIRHVSVLVKEAIPLFKNEEDAKRYYEAHKQKDTGGFERLRRITGYLVGTVARWNDFKKAELRDRTPHTVPQGYSLRDKIPREQLKEHERVKNQV